MNIKKLLITGSAFLATLIIGVTSSLAVSHVGVYGIKMIREGGYGYKMDGSIIWRVVKYNNCERWNKSYKRHRTN